jgi:hypothetical protein
MKLFENARTFLCCVSGVFCVNHVDPPLQASKLMTVRAEEIFEKVHAVPGHNDLTQENGAYVNHYGEAFFDLNQAGRLGLQSSRPRLRDAGIE